MDRRGDSRGVVFDLGANEVEEFGASPFASREVTPEGHVFAGGEQFGAMGGDDAESAAARTMAYARMLGMEGARDGEFMWIADEMARTELPPGWAEVAAKGRGLAFLDTSTQIVSDEHPMAGYYKKLFQRHKGEAAGRGDTPEGAPSIGALEARLAPMPGEEPELESSGEESLDSEDSDYEERLARRRARSRRRRSSGSNSGKSEDDSDSDKENEASRKMKARARKAERKGVRQQIMEAAEAKSAAPVKRKTARDRVMEKAAEMSEERSPEAREDGEQEQEQEQDEAAGTGAGALDTSAPNQRAAGKVRDRQRRRDADESVDEDTANLRAEQKSRKREKEEKQKARESLVTAKERRQIEKVALRREREQAKAVKRQEQEQEQEEQQQEQQNREKKKDQFREGMEEEYKSKNDEFRAGYANDHPVAVSKREKKQREEEKKRLEEEEAIRRAEGAAELAAGEAERARLAKDLRKEQRRSKRAMMAGYNDDADMSSGGNRKDETNGRRKKKRGHRRRADEEEEQLRRQDNQRQHAVLQREEEEAAENEKARKRKQAELEAALEAMQDVFGQDRDEKLLTIWLAEAMHDVAAAINLGLAHDQRAEEQRLSEAAHPEAYADPLDQALDGIAVKLAETVTHSAAAAEAHPDDENIDPAEREALEALRAQMEEFGDALGDHATEETAEEKRARKDAKKAAKREAKKAAAAAAFALPSGGDEPPPQKAAKKFGMLGKLFGGKKKKAQEEEAAAAAAAQQLTVSAPPDGEEDTTRPRSRSPEKSSLRSPSGRSSGSGGSGGSGDKPDSGGLKIGEACEVYSQSQENWVAGAVTEVGHRQVAVEYGHRTRTIDLADENLGEYFRATTLRPLRPLRSASVRSNISSTSSRTDPRDVRFEVGDRVEIFSESSRAWIPGVVIEVRFMHLKITILRLK